MQASTARCHLSNLEYIHQTMLEPDPIVVDSRRYALIPTDGYKKCQMMLSGFDPALAMMNTHSRDAQCISC